MRNLDDIINNSRDVREMKRALSVKMALQGLKVNEIVSLLNVSPQFISKWRVKYEASGADSLILGYRGSESYLSIEERAVLIGWVKSHETITIETVRDHIEETYGVVYQSKQSYYDLLAVAGMSYHKSEKRNPKHDEAQVLIKREEVKKNGRALGGDKMWTYGGSDAG